MSELTKLLTEPPVWIWPLLALLIFVGIKSTKHRRIPTFLVYILPLIGFTNIPILMNLQEQPMVWTVFSGAIVIGTVIGFVLQKIWIITKEKHHITLAGEWVTMISVMVLFWANYVSGTIQSQRPDFYANVGFIVAFVTIIAVFSGWFFGCALRVAITKKNQ